MADRFPWKDIPRMFDRLAGQHRELVKDLILNLHALSIALEKKGYMTSWYTCGDVLESASFMVSLADGHQIRFFVSDTTINWTERRDNRELMKLEGAEAIGQLQELANLLKVPAPVLACVTK
jgi:Domain of unknown function (DUF1815)